MSDAKTKTEYGIIIETSGDTKEVLSGTVYPRNGDIAEAIRGIPHVVSVRIMRRQITVRTSDWENVPQAPMDLAP